MSFGENPTQHEAPEQNNEQLSDAEMRKRGMEEMRTKLASSKNSLRNTLNQLNTEKDGDQSKSDSLVNEVGKRFEAQIRRSETSNYFDVYKEGVESDLDRIAMLTKEELDARIDFNDNLWNGDSTGEELTPQYIDELANGIVSNFSEEREAQERMLAQQEIEAERARQAEENERREAEESRAREAEQRLAETRREAEESRARVGAVLDTLTGGTVSNARENMINSRRY